MWYDWILFLDQVQYPFEQLPGKLKMIIIDFKF